MQCTLTCAPFGAPRLLRGRSITRGPARLAANRVRDRVSAHFVAGAESFMPFRPPLSLPKPRRWPRFITFVAAIITPTDCGGPASPRNVGYIAVHFWGAQHLKKSDVFRPQKTFDLSLLPRWSVARRHHHPRPPIIQPTCALQSSLYDSSGRFRPPNVIV